MKFVSLCAELYIGTASRDWQKHKIAVISVKNGDFLIAFTLYFSLTKNDLGIVEKSEKCSDL